MELQEGEDYRLVGELEMTDKIMNDSFWVGVYPGMGQEAIAYMVQTIRQYVGQYADK
jgi:CDP-6-deoxy-D-xylo-4-hexulose-3-dehydrase